MRDIIALACTECKRRNYSTTKNKKKTTERLEMSKFCRFCRKHTAHKEGEVGIRNSGFGLLVIRFRQIANSESRSPGMRHVGQ